jgi:hypothetical protein
MATKVAVEARAPSSRASAVVRQSRSEFTRARPGAGAGVSEAQLRLARVTYGRGRRRLRVPGRAAAAARTLLYSAIAFTGRPMLLCSHWVG